MDCIISVKSRPIRSRRDLLVEIEIEEYWQGNFYANYAKIRETFIRLRGRSRKLFGGGNFFLMSLFFSIFLIIFIVFFSFSDGFLTYV